MTDPILVDANPLLSALLGRRARDVLFSRQFLFHSPQHTLFEVGKYIPTVAEKTGQTELALYRELQLLPVTAVQPRVYELQLEKATRLIGRRDWKDIHLLALAL